MSQPNINTPNSDLVSSLSQSQSYLSPNFLVILPGLTSSVRLCGVERCPAQQSEEEEEEESSQYPDGLLLYSSSFYFYLRIVINVFLFITILLL